MDISTLKTPYYGNGICTNFCVKKWYFHCTRKKMMDWGTILLFFPEKIFVKNIRTNIWKIPRENTWIFPLPSGENDDFVPPLCSGNINSSHKSLWKCLPLFPPGFFIYFVRRLSTKQWKYHFFIQKDVEMPHWRLEIILVWRVILALNAHNWICHFGTLDNKIYEDRWNMKIVGDLTRCPGQTFCYSYLSITVSTLLLYIYVYSNKYVYVYV